MGDEMQSENDATVRTRARIVTRVLISAGLITFMIAAMLMWLVAPLLRANSAIAASPESLPPFVHAMASAVSGFVLLLGLAVNSFAPRRAAGRGILLIGGLMVAMSGAMLANDTLESGWPGIPGVIGLVCGLVQVAIGLLAWIASLSDWLPGPSLVKQMWAQEPVPPDGGGRPGLLVLTAAVGLGWLFCALAVVSRFDLERTGMAAWFVAVWGMPILIGMVVGGWRERNPNRLQSLGLAALAGMTLDLLYLVVLGVWYYRFNPIGFALWWAIMGAIFGATGFALWQYVVRRGSKLHLGGRRRGRHALQS